MEEEEEEDKHYKNHRRRRRHHIPEPKWLSFQADIIYHFISTLFSPLTLFFSMAFESYRRTEAAAATVESRVLKVPSMVIRGSILLGKRVGVGILGAVHVLMVLIGVMILAGILGVGLVRIWVEEPVILKDRVLFDYSELNPTAVFDFGGVNDGIKISNQLISVPIGHTFHVSLELLMPESDYNRHIGVFQLNAELLSVNGIVIAKSSQPCILTFRSLPIRLIRTCFMSIPLVLGISAETQKMSVQILNHKESYPRTKAIRVTLIPRPGTTFLPQIYESKILVKSKLPWTKQLIHNWRWTVSVWVTLYIYILLVVFLIGFCRPLLFPIGTVFMENNHDDSDTSTKELEEPELGTVAPDEREVSELLKKWQERRERKAVAAQTGSVETAESSDSSMSFASEDTSLVVEEDVAAIGSSSATSMSFTREDTSVFGEEYFGYSESVCSDD